jgi:type VI secretion system protein ImpG
MEHRFVRYYEAELRYIRELAAEFSRQFPKVGGRLGLNSSLACDDPHVERLLQGFAFSAGRTHMALDAEFSALTQPLIEQLYRNFAAPTPSMAVVQFSVDAQSSGLGTGFTVPRDTLLEARSGPRSGGGSRCEFRTAHAVRLLPIAIESATYTSVLRDLDGVRVPTREPIRAVLKLKLRSHNMSFARLNLQSLPLFVNGRDQVSNRLYEQLNTSASALIMRWGTHGSAHVALGSDPRPVHACGFGPEHALLPSVAPELEPYRLLQEYFACPARFNSVELTGLASGTSACASEELDLIVALTRFDPSLEHAVEADRLVLFATPVVNLFPRNCGRVTVHGDKETAIVADSTRPLDFEVHSVTQVTTHTNDRNSAQELQPAYASQGAHADTTLPRYLLRRHANPLPERLSGATSRYVGSDVLMRLVAPHGAAEARPLNVHALCTNRDLPLSLALGDAPPGSRDFDVRSGVPADAVRCIAAPTAPGPAQIEGPGMWRFLSHLSPNYLAIHKETGGVNALRDLLELYAEPGAPHLQRQIDGVRNIDSQPVIGPIPGPGPRRYTRGLEIQLECEEQAFGGQGAFVLAAVLARLFSKHVSANSFAQTVLTTSERGKVHTFKGLPGLGRLI